MEPKARNQLANIEEELKIGYLEHDTVNSLFLRNDYLTEVSINRGPGSRKTQVINRRSLQTL